MKAIILAAGKGERLGNITSHTPKPMVKYKGKPILQYNIELIKDSGVDEVFINVHHLAGVIRDYFKNGKQLGVKINYSHEEDLLGTSGAVKRISKIAPDFLTEPFFVIYGDNLSQYDLGALVKKSVETGSIGVIGFHHREDVSTSGVAEFGSNYRIISFIEKPQSGETLSHWVNAGIYYFKPEILNYIPDGHSDFAKDIFTVLLKNEIPIFGVCNHDDVKAFDTPEMLDRNLQ